MTINQSRRSMPSRVKIVVLIVALGASASISPVMSSAATHQPNAATIRLQEDDLKRKRPPKKGKEKREAEKETPKQEPKKEAEKTDKAEKEKSKAEAKTQGFGWGTIVLTVVLTLGAAAGGLFFLWKYKAKSVVKALESSEQKSAPIVVEASVIHTEPILAKKESEPQPTEAKTEKPRQIERLPARDAISYKDAPKFEEPSGAAALDESPMLFDDTALNAADAGNSVDAAMINQLIEKQSDKDNGKSDVLDTSDGLILPDDEADNDLLEIPKKETQKIVAPAFEDRTLDESLLNGMLLDDSAFSTVALYNAATTPIERQNFAEQMIACAVENFDDVVKRHDKPVLSATSDGVFLVSKTPIDGATHYELFVTHGLSLTDADVQSRIKPLFNVFYSDDVETEFQLKTPATVTKHDDRWTLVAQGEILLKA